jgi:hypothetical protein
MPARRSGVTARRRGNLLRLLRGVYPERKLRFFALLRMTLSEGLAMTLLRNEGEGETPPPFS